MQDAAVAARVDSWILCWHLSCPQSSTRSIHLWIGATCVLPILKFYPCSHVILRISPLIWMPCGLLSKTSKSNINLSTSTQRWVLYLNLSEIEHFKKIHISTTLIFLLTSVFISSHFSFLILLQPLKDCSLSIYSFTLLFVKRKVKGNTFCFWRLRPEIDFWDPILIYPRHLKKS